MLDEYIEYKEYIDYDYLDYIVRYNSSLNNSKLFINNRLKLKQTKNNFSGLRRPLIVISKYLNSKYNNIDVTINGLNAWLGLEYNKNLNDEINSISNYVYPKLFDFYKQNAKNDKSIETINTIMNKFLKKNFNEDIINDESRASKNGVDDYNKISIKSIAYNNRFKSLKQRVLVCHKDVLEDVVNIKGKKISDKQMDYVLKIIASYLIYKKSSQNKVRLVVSDLDNWSLYRHEDSYETNNYIFSDGELLIKKYNDFNVVKYDLDSRIKENFEIVEKKNIEKKVKIGDIVYIDKGSRDVMKKRVIEEKSDIMNLLQELSDVFIKW